MYSRLFPSSQPRDQLSRYISPLTFLKCDNCGTVHSRQFKEGDYVFKQVEENCPKCNSSSMLVISIHVEEKTQHQ